MHIFNLKNHFFSETVKGRLTGTPPMFGCKPMISWFPLYFFINQSIDWSIMRSPGAVCWGLDWRALPSWWTELEAKECPSSAITVWALWLWCWNWSLDDAPNFFGEKGCDYVWMMIFSEESCEIGGGLPRWWHAGGPSIWRDRKANRGETRHFGANLSKWQSELTGTS